MINVGLINFDPCICHLVAGCGQITDKSLHSLGQNCPMLQSINFSCTNVKILKIHTHQFSVSKVFAVSGYISLFLYKIFYFMYKLCQIMYIFSWFLKNGFFYTACPRIPLSVLKAL